MKRLEGRIAVVTGASRGIGRGIALRLAAEGALVAVHYGTRRDSAEETVSAIEAAGGIAFAVGAELNSLDGVNRLLQILDEELIRRTGVNQFDILVNNAGIGTSSSFEETSEEDFDRLFAINVKAPFFLVQQSLGRVRNGGRIINISSGVTRIAYPHIMAYNLTKGALNTFTLHLAQLLGPRGITVNAVMPGIVDTDVNASWLHTPEGRKYAEGMSALGRVGEPTDIADIVAFAASPDGRWVTGQMLDATGGSHL
ncbi:short-chain dehydrogenase [Paenibacillus sp. IHB B 3415]|uniref:SDR family oxidoreductase n=1 Tax=Paenibacillus sp. IHB B 3415 TaxID=867080 RepID=UPI0005735AF9|nr:SDR family oxidoreductase [Paenibacillus sp. IHB B 3415]KHL96279.1 short-chain dehydrogenase [Paenibacillus sp. IHB B 3415]